MRTTSTASPRGGMASTTRTVPVSVVHSVSSTSVSPRYLLDVQVPPFVKTALALGAALMALQTLLHLVLRFGSGSRR